MKLKKLPIGIETFSEIVQVKIENYYYIDKTKFIEQIEQEADFLFFLRPRRFGKSLTISMLEYYFDAYYKEEFEETFKNTYIFENPTALKNSFYIYETTLKSRIVEAKNQLNQYDLGKRYLKIVLVFRGWELVYCEEAC